MNATTPAQTPAQTTVTSKTNASDRASARSRSIQARLTRLVVSVILITFAVVGLVTFVAIRNSARGEIGQEHQALLFQLRQDINNELSTVSSDLSRLANEPAVRQFAAATVSMDTASLTSIQTAVLGNFVELAQLHPGEYVEIRYVTRTGSVWTQVTGYDGIETDTEVHTDALRDDEALVNSLRQTNIVTMGPLRFRRDAENRMVQPPQPLLRFSAPVVSPEDNTTILAALQIDVAAMPLLERVNNAVSGDALPERRFVMMNNLGQMMADSDDPAQTFASRGVPGASSSFGIREPALDLAMRNRLGDFNAVETGGDIFSNVDISLPNSPSMPWRLIVVDNAAIALGRNDLNALAALALCLTAGVLLSLGMRALIRRILRPLTTATSLVQHVMDADTSDAAGPAQPTAAPAADLATSDEVAQLVEAFQTQSRRVQELTQELETQVGRYTRNIEIAARIGRETATLYDTDQLLNRAINLIVREFGFYHAQVFLLDDVGLNAVLAYSYGDAGRQMLERRHRLTVGSPSVIGAVTSTAQPVVINDTTAEGSGHRFNPLLPDTQAEMAVPLMVSGTVIGALDIQSDEPNVFHDEELQMFQLLADQIAVAINNARLLQESDARVEQINALNRQLTRAAWDESNQLAALDEAYRYDLMRIERERANERANEDATEGEPPGESAALRAEIAIRGEVIGALAAAAPDGSAFTEADEALMRSVAERVALAIENARLFGETSQALDETRRLYSASRAITSASDSEAAYQAAAINLVEGNPQLHRLALLMAAPTPSMDAPLLEYQFLHMNATSNSHTVRIGSRLPRHDVPFAEMIAEAGGVVAVANVATDLPTLPGLRTLLEDQGTNSFIVVPVQTGRKWLGVLLLESDRRDAFDAAYQRFAQAVADQLAIAIDNRQLFEEAQAEATRARALAEAGQLANRIGGSFEETIGELFARVASPANYDRWLLMLTDPTGTRIEKLTEHQPDSEEGRDLAFDLTGRSAHSIVDAVKQQRTIIVNDVVNYPAFTVYNTDYSQSIGKHIVTPLRVGAEVIGGLLVGRPYNAPELDERDEQLVTTLAAQVAVALENRRLFLAAEGERQTLRSTLETLPAGVLVLDATTYQPIQFNEQAERLLGRAIDTTTPFDPAAYGIYRSGTTDVYPANALPVFTAQAEAGQVDDVAVLQSDGTQIDLLVHAAPIVDVDSRGSVRAIVAAFTDISNLRGLEHTLQENLRDTITLYEATRGLADAVDEDAILDIVVEQISTLDPSEGYVVLLDEDQRVQLARSIDGATRFFPLPEAILDPQRTIMIQSLDGKSSLTARVKGQLLALGVQSVVSLPLRARSRRGAPIGWTVITFDTARELTPEEERFLTTINDAAAVALDNRSLFRSTEVALQETASLYTATTSISRARDLGELSGALQTALESLAPDLYAAYLIPYTGSSSIEMFSINLDGAPVHFHPLVEAPELTQLEELVVEDLRAQSASGSLETSLMSLGTIRAAAVVNLSIKGAGKGSLIVAYHQPRRFADSDVRYLKTVADSASVVIDNILLFDQIQSTLDETSTLYQASRALGDATSADDILNVVVEHLADSETGVAFLATLGGEDWNAQGAYADIAAHWEREPNPRVRLGGITFTPGQSSIWRPLASPEIVLVENVAGDERLTELERIGLEGLGLKAVAILPLRAGRRAIGALVLGSSHPRRYEERDLRIYQSFAEQASLKMEATRLLEQTERRARQLATSAEVSRSASTLLDLDQLLPRLVELIRDSFGYDHAQIFLMDANDEYAELRASTGDAGKVLLDLGHKLAKGSSSVIGQVTSTGEPVIALDTAETGVVHRPNPYLPNTRSEMAVPLVLKNRVVGAIDVQSNSANAFDQDDVAVLTTLAAQIAVAIDNADLFAEAGRRANEMAFLFDVTTAAASSDSVQSALEGVADQLRQSLDAAAVSIYLPQPALDGQGNPDLLVAVAMAGSAQPLSELSEIDLTADNRNLLATAARTQRPIIVSNTEIEPRYLPVVTSAQSAVIVPLASGNQLVGLITVESHTLNAYNDDTLTLLLTLSGSLSAIVTSQQLLEQVQRTNEELRTLDKLKSDFLANMSHELRTPLNSIIGFSRVILKGIDGPLTEMQEQDLTTIYTSGQHLLNLINDILDQAKISANKMDLQPDYFEVKPVIDGVRSIGIGLVKDKPIDIYVDIASGLPKAYGDEFRTRQILLNLVSNAAKFTREGSITMSVYAEPDAETGQPMVRIDVTDTGIGIAEKDVPLLFEAFRQVDSSLTRTVGGTGLGLPIAKSLVEMQGGRMMVHSQVNVGSTFTITIPIAPPDDPERKRETQTADTVDAQHDTQTNLKPGDQPSNGATGSNGANGAPPRPDTRTVQIDREALLRPPVMTKRQILIIDDNPDMVDQFRRILQREGFDIFAASIPLEAEAMASGLHPTLIVLDVNFASGGGWDILNKLKTRDDTLDIPVIVVTLSNDDDRAADMGAFRFIRRPFMPEALVQAVHEAEQDSRTDRILIIDDQPESVRLLQELLREHGDYRVFSAHSGQDGIALVARRRPNLILLDLRMPDMDGFAVVEELRANPETAQIPILVVTGDTLTDGERERLRSLDVIHKTDISLEAYLNFIEGVRTHLAKSNGV